MTFDFIDEPELEFGGGGRHIDIRFGIMDYGPADVEAGRAPKRIHVGVIGTPANAEGLQLWLERCRAEIPAKQSRQPNLFPRFPGFNPEEAFRSTLVLDSAFNREIAARDVERIARSGDHNVVVAAAVERFAAEMQFVKEKGGPDVFLCAVPPEIEALMDPDLRPGGGKRGAGDGLLDFHDLLKSHAMQIGIPTQLVLPGTYDPGQRRRQKKKPQQTRALQDAATSAWNFHTALYYKAGGLPWRLIRDRSEFQTCFVGVSFYYAVDRSNILTSMAQIFDERGDGIVVRGAPIRLSKSDRTPHLEEQDAQTLLVQALKHYRLEHETAPARVVLHKTSRFNAAEREGFSAALEEERIGRVDFVSMTDRAAPRLFRAGAYPVLRGSSVALSAREHLLYTRGSVDFFRTYPGMYVPRPLHFHCDETMSTPRALSREILSLTKMNWNKTQFDQSEPITVHAARSVGQILKYVEADGRIESRYSYYM
jgi:hypothetical protein